MADIPPPRSVLPATPPRDLSSSPSVPSPASVESSFSTPFSPELYHPESPSTPATSISWSQSTHQTSPTSPLPTSATSLGSKPDTSSSNLKPSLSPIITGFPEDAPCLQCRVLNMRCSFKTERKFRQTVRRAQLNGKVIFDPLKSEHRNFSSPWKGNTGSITDLDTKPPSASISTGYSSHRESPQTSSVSESKRPYHGGLTAPKDSSQDCLTGDPFSDTAEKKDSMPLNQRHPLNSKGCSRCIRNGEPCCILESQEGEFKSGEWVRKRFFRLPGFEEVVEGVGNGQDISMGAGLGREVDMRVAFKLKVLKKRLLELEAKEDYDGQDVGLVGYDEHVTGDKNKLKILDVVRLRIEELLATEFLERDRRHLVLPRFEKEITVRMHRRLMGLR